MKTHAISSFIRKIYTFRPETAEINIITADKVLNIRLSPEVVILAGLS